MGRKVSSGKVSATNMRENLKPGEILTDLTGKQWLIGKPIGVGGFGEIYLVSDVLNQEVAGDSPYVAKIENHSNGPLFVEINCYLRIAKVEMIEEWKQENGLTTLGMPHYVASGSHLHSGNKYRFLILPRYRTDLESVLEQNKRFNLKTVLTVSMQIIDTLQYIHSKGYVHSDIKASNILLGRAEKKVVVKKPVFCYNRTCNPVRKCRMRNDHRPVRSSRSKVFYLDDVPDFRAIEQLIEEEQVAELKKSLEKTSEIDQVYLLDYGLASKYRTTNNVHKPYCNDERRAHMGTMLFCSRDAHKGAQSRRSDLECLAFNIVYWLSGCLPWQDELHDPTLVEKRKERCMSNVDAFLRRCCRDDYPEFLMEFFQYLKKLSFEEKPDYAFCKKLFRKALKDYGHKNDNKFDFNSCEKGWGVQKQKKVDGGGARKRPQMSTLTRLPLHSNFSVKSPKRLRGNIDKQLACLKWSKILIDPEIIIKRQKKSRERKSTTEPSDLKESVSVFNMDDISELNPTYAMIEVFSKSKERLLNGTFGNHSPSHKSESEITNIEGYTPAMMAVLARMKEDQLLAEMDRDHSDDSEDEYYYKFPEPKKSTSKPTKRKGGLKRKAATATASSCCNSPRKTRNCPGERKMAAATPAKRGHRLRG